MSSRVPTSGSPCSTTRESRTQTRNASRTHPRFGSRSDRQNTFYLLRASFPSFVLTFPIRSPPRRNGNSPESNHRFQDISASYERIVTDLERAAAAAAPSPSPRLGEGMPFVFSFRPPRDTRSRFDRDDRDRSNESDGDGDDEWDSDDDQDQARAARLSRSLPFFSFVSSGLTLAPPLFSTRRGILLLAV